MWLRPLWGVTVGSCATGAREPGQGRKAAALSDACRVPQIAWPSLPKAGAFCFDYGSPGAQSSTPATEIRFTESGETSVIQEFKDFINNGNVFETAVGLILALAFAPVVTGFIEHIIMPIIAAIVGEPNFDGIGIDIGDARINVGTWLTIVVGFMLIALVMFFLVKAYNKANAPEAEAAAGPSEIDLLTEIRDSLAK
jgi:large conductance mechanosensitive channel